MKNVMDVAKLLANDALNPFPAIHVPLILLLVQWMNIILNLISENQKVTRIKNALFVEVNFAKNVRNKTIVIIFQHVMFAKQYHVKAVGSMDTANAVVKQPVNVALMKMIIAKHALHNHNTFVMDTIIKVRIKIQAIAKVYKVGEWI